MAVVAVLAGLLSLDISGRYWKAFVLLYVQLVCTMLHLMGPPQRYVFNFIEEDLQLCQSIYIFCFVPST